MASQVLSGSSNFTYTNNTGQNVRIVINYMKAVTSLSWSASGGGTVSVSETGTITIGKNLAYVSNTGIHGQNMTSSGTSNSFPTEIMLASGQIFSATCGVYNVLIIKEDGT